MKNGYGVLGLDLQVGILSGLMRQLCCKDAMETFFSQLNN